MNKVLANLLENYDLKKKKGARQPGQIKFKVGGAGA